MIVETTQPLSKKDLKPLVVEILRNLAQQNGCLVVLNFILREKNWPKEALKALENGEWDDTVVQLFTQQFIWHQSLREYLSRLPLSAGSDPSFLMELERSEGRKLVRFYDSLIALVRNIFSEDELVSIASEKPQNFQFETHPQTFVQSTQFALNMGRLTELFEIPTDPKEQLQLIKDLAPLLFRDWKYDDFV